jgi:hypothetical protein
MTNTIKFRDKTISLNEDPRRGVCNVCRYVVDEIHPISVSGPTIQLICIMKSMTKTIQQLT